MSLETKLEQRLAVASFCYCNEWAFLRRRRDDTVQMVVRVLEHLSTVGLVFHPGGKRAGLDLRNH